MTTLDEELALPAYTGKTDAEATVMLNTKNRPAPVPAIDVKRNGNYRAPKQYANC